MRIHEVAHAAAHVRGMLGDLPNFESETKRSVRWMVAEGMIERRERTVDIKPQPHDNMWPAMNPSGPRTIVTWHLTPSGREAWLAGKL
jgi:hypothetical protein